MCLAATATVPYPPSLVAVDGTTNGGATWTPRFTQRGVTSFSSVSCATPAACLATGASVVGGFVEATSSAGASWVARPGLSTYEAVAQVGCLTASTCIATTEDNQDTDPLIITKDAGATWTQLALATAATPPQAVTCTSSTRCFANTEADLFVTNDAGSSWTEVSLPSTASSPTVTSVACPSRAECVGSARFDGGVLFMTSADGGSTWTTVGTLPNAYWSDAQTGCSSTQDCVTLAQSYGPSGYFFNLFASSDGGASWTSSSGLAAYDWADDLLCTSDGGCEAVAGTTSNPDPAPLMVTSMDNAKTWTASRVPLDAVNAMACTAVDACIAVGEAASGGPAIARRSS